MKILHVFPSFGHDLTNGSDYYAYKLTTGLSGLGHEIDVFTTCARSIIPEAAFSIRWPNNYPPGLEHHGNIKVYRFPTNFSLYRKLGEMASMQIIERWKKEEDSSGIVIPGSRNLISSYERRARSRSIYYDLLAMIGRGPWSGSMLFNLVREIRRYDFVLVGFVPFSLVGQVVSIARLCRVPVGILALFHPEDLFHHFRSIYYILAKANLILAQTAYTEALFRELAPGSNPINIGAGVDLAELADSRICGARFRAKYQLANKFVVLSVGRKEPGKGYQKLIEAVELIDDRNVVLVLIGEDVDHVPITSSHVLYLGKVSHKDKLDAFAACDVFASLSLYESFGIVFLEAWSFRKPVIGNLFCKPHTALIQEGVNGFLCAAPKSVALKIIDLARDQSVREALGNAGHKVVSERYDWSHIANIVDLAYKTNVERLQNNHRTDFIGSDDTRKTLEHLKSGRSTLGDQY